MKEYESQDGFDTKKWIGYDTWMPKGLSRDRPLHADEWKDRTDTMQVLVNR